MEAVWIAAGILAGGGAVLLWVRTSAHQGAQPVGHWVTQEQLAQELDRLRLHVDDIYDKVQHLYDRVRKRMGPAWVEPEKANGSEPIAASGKAGIRARARMGGMLGVTRS
jgi:hypothetical protein